MADVWILAPDPAGTCCDCTARVNVCDSCSTTVCGCKFIMPSFPWVPLPVTPYANLTAAIAIRDARIAGNFAFALQYSIDMPIVSFSASNPSNTSVIIAGTNSRVQEIVGPPAVYGGSVGALFDFSVPVNTDITIRCDISDPGTLGSNGFVVQMNGYCGAGDYFNRNDNFFGSSTLIFNSVLAGEYTMLLNYGGYNSLSAGGSVSATFTITLSNAGVINPIVLQYFDSSSNTCILDIPPKLLLPIGTEVTNSWYADLASAQSAITNYSSNCVGFYAPMASSNIGYTYTANGTTSFHSVLNAIGINGPPFPEQIIFSSISNYFSANLLAGAVISMSYSVTIDNLVHDRACIIRLYITDRDGNYATAVTDSFTSTIGSHIYTGSVSTSALLADGKYNMEIVVQALSIAPVIHQINVDATITSSSTMSVNTIQALYSTGLICPARLDC